MNVGEIHVWDSTQAIGYAIKRKYHAYLCEAGWRAEGHAFLFINSGNYGADYKICKADYSFLVRDSFVSCAGVVTYPEIELIAAKPLLVGTLSKLYLSELYKSIAESETMAGWQITMCCEALKGFVA
jgi:hypothetical protein